ncbi:hypothetical protein RB595_007709 [Gaeumannomyces hyphopodioides]
MTGKQGTSSRGRGKFKNYSRGGGRSFSRGLRPIDDEGNEVSMWSEEAQQKDGTLDEEDEEDEESEDEDEEEAPKAKKEKPPTREQLKAAKKAKKAAAAAKAAEAEKKVEVGDMPPSSDEEESEDEVPAKAAPAKK